MWLVGHFKCPYKWLENGNITPNNLISRHNSEIKLMCYKKLHKASEEATK